MARKPIKPLAAAPKPPAARIVEAVGTASTSTTPGLSKRIEKAMSDAVLACMEKGVTDPAKQREAMQAARQRVKDEVAAEERKRAEQAITASSSAKNA